MWFKYREESDKKFADDQKAKILHLKTLELPQKIERGQGCNRSIQKSVCSLLAVNT